MKVARWTLAEQAVEGVAKQEVEAYFGATGRAWTVDCHHHAPCAILLALAEAAWCASRHVLSPPPF